MYDSPWNGSYRLGFDHRFSHESIYLFTFYSEFRSEATRWEPWLEAGLLSLLLATSLVTNTLLAVGLLRASQRSVTNTFLTSLWSADCIFALGIPAVVAARLLPDWPLGEAVCRLLPFSQLVCGFTILWSLTLISVERYRCLTLDPRLQVTVSSTGLLVTCMWLLGCTLFTPVLLWFRHEPDLGICTLVFPKASPFKISLIFTASVILFACLLPMAILVYNYHRIFLKLMSSRERWSRGCAQTSSLTRQERQRIRKHIKIMRTVLMNVVVVVLMWVPVAAVLILIYLDGDRGLHDTHFFLRSYHFIGALGLALLNTAVNPLLSGALRSSCCHPKARSTPSLSRLLRIGSSGN